MEAGIKLMREGYISKGLDRVEGKGVVPVEGHCMMQMIGKHPQRWNELPTIPEPPPGAEETDVSEQLPEVIRKANPRVGVGPRGLHPHHL